MYKNITLIFFSILCFIGCEEVALEKAPEVTHEFVSINADPVLGALREEARSKVNRSSSGRITSDWLDNAQWEKVYHVHDEASALSTYTVPVSNDTPDVLDLLVINTRDGSSNYGVFSLMADEAWLNERGGFTGMSDFSGQVEVAGLDGKVWISSVYENGQRVVTGGTATGKTAACETWIDISWTEVCIEGNCAITNIEIEEYEVCDESGDGGTGGPLGGPIGPSEGGNGEGGSGGGPGNGGGPIGFEEPVICQNGQLFEDGICIEVEDKLCPTIIFDHIQNGFTAQVTELRVRVLNISNGQSETIRYPVVCITFPEYNISNSLEASQYFAEIFDYAARVVQHEVQMGSLAFVNSSMQQRLTALIKSEMTAYFPGSAFSNGNCFGNVTTTVAEYDC